MGLALLEGCTRANPAYRIAVHGEDAADSPPAEADAAAAPDRSSPADAAPADELPAPADLAPSPDLAADLAPPPDLAPDLARDLVPDVAPDAGVSPSGLVAHWRFDERSGTTAADASGNGNTGTTHGGPTWTTTGFPAAKFANAGALVLDGVDDYVEIAGKNIPSNTAPKSLCAWFKAVNPTGILIRNLVALINDTSDVGIQLGLDQGRVAAWYYGLPTPLVNAADPVDSNWHHAAYTFDGRTHRLYYDGKMVVSVDDVPKAGAITRTRLGTYQAPDELFAGTIDDVRIYARPLGDAEVSALWNGQ